MIHQGKKESLFIALDELKYMVKKTDRENIIKIKAFSYKMNRLNYVTKFYIIMEKFKSSLKITVDYPKMFDKITIK